MGDPKFSSRSYNTPSHPWQGERIKEEAGIVKRYGLKNKRELWKAKTIVHNLRKQSRDLQARLRTGEEQAKKETVALLRKCARMGLLPMEALVDVAREYLKMPDFDMKHATGERPSTGARS